MAYRLIFFSAIFPFIFLSFNSCKNENDTLSFYAMDTVITIKSSGRGAKKANLKAKQEIQRIENLISTTNKNSAISLLNRATDFPQKLDRETYYLIDFALQVAQQTDGALNPFLYPVTKLWGFTTDSFKVPTENEINSALKLTDFTKVKLTTRDDEYFLTMNEQMLCDLGAIGKGYAGERAKQVLRENGIKSAVIDLGGNIELLGSKFEKGFRGKDKAWKIGIKNPLKDRQDLDSALGFIQEKDKAIVTSGGYERFFYENGKTFIHIFDPKTGRPVENSLASVTVVADSALYADALSTVLFVLGEDSAYEFWKNKGDFEYLLVYKDGTVFCSKGLKDKFTPLY